MNYEFGQCAVFGEKKHPTSDLSEKYSIIDAHPSDPFLCTEVGWHQFCEIEEACTKEPNIRMSSSRSWYEGSTVQLSNWWWVCKNGEWQFIKDADLDDYLNAYE